MTQFSFWQIATAVMLSACALNVCAQDCKAQEHQAHSNLTILLTVQMPDNASAASVGTVLNVNEKTLSQFTGSHHDITTSCLDEIKRVLNGRMNTAQSGNNIFRTSLPGVGLRITVIYDKPGMAKKEWVLPFNTSFTDLSKKAVNNDDIKLRIEVIKTGIIQGGTSTIRLPSLISLSDNSLIVNLAMTVLSAKAHCAILADQAQIELPPVDVKNLSGSTESKNYPVGVNLQCINTTRVSINIEGAIEPDKITVFKNVAPVNPATGVGIEMLYNGSVMTPFHPFDISLSTQQVNVAVPLSVRYATTNQPLTAGKVKAQITLRVNYL